MKLRHLLPLQLALTAFVGSPVLAQDHSQHGHRHHARHQQHDSHQHDQHQHGHAHEHEHEHEHGHEHAHEHGHASGPYFPPITDADRAAAFPDLGQMTMADHGMDDNAIYFKTLVDGLAWQRPRHGGEHSLAWNATTWIGRDINRLWLKTSGERRAGHTENLQLQALWGHALGPWWDSVIGIRHDSRPGPSQTRLALGFQGLAPYQFEIHSLLYLGGHGRAELHLEAEYELLFTYRWILTPSLGTHITARDDPRHGISSGWNGLDAGFKLRYEIRPNLAPYIGYTRHGIGQNPHSQWQAGLRFWF